MLAAMELFDFDKDRQIKLTAEVSCAG